MRAEAPFQPDDLAALDERLLSRASAVVAMEDIYYGHAIDAIGLRHDVDNVIEPAVWFAEWEADRGYRSTYYILHSAPYWQDKSLLRRSLERIWECGHEIAIHNNALAEHFRTRRDPVEILAEAIGELRSYGYPIRSTVAHGDHLCHEHKFVNDELFVECARPTYGDPDRICNPVSLRQFGLDFDANWLRRSDYLSDSGGHWSQPFDKVAAAFPPEGQLHVLIHADWWPEAFDREKAAA